MGLEMNNTLVNAQDRNREMAIQQREHAKNPQVIEQREAEELQRNRDIVRDSVISFLEMLRSRLRIAAHPFGRAKSRAEHIIKSIDGEVRSKYGDLRGDVAILGAYEYIQNLEKELVPLLEEVGAIARGEQTEIQRSERERRETSYRVDAQRLGLLGVAKLLESNGSRLELVDGRLTLRGPGAPD
ncbi:MAG: hypothetical protein WA624_20300, partial [Methylocella sp.]